MPKSAKTNAKGILNEIFFCIDRGGREIGRGTGNKARGGREIARGGRKLTAAPLLPLAKLAWGAAYVFAELAAKVFHVAVAADFGDFQNGAGGVE